MFFGTWIKFNQVHHFTCNLPRCCPCSCRLCWCLIHYIHTRFLIMLNVSELFESVNMHVKRDLKNLWYIFETESHKEYCIQIDYRIATWHGCLSNPSMQYKLGAFIEVCMADSFHVFTNYPILSRFQDFRFQGRFHQSGTIEQHWMTLLLLTLMLDTHSVYTLRVHSHQVSVTMLQQLCNTRDSVLIEINGNTWKWAATSFWSVIAELSPCWSWCLV